MSGQQSYEEHQRERQREQYEIALAEQEAEYARLDTAMCALRARFHAVYRAVQAEVDPWAPLRAILNAAQEGPGVSDVERS